MSSIAAQAEARQGPVSVALEKELREWVRRHGIALWLDADGSYSAFVDRLMAAEREGSLPYPVRAFRGSYLELMLELEGLTRSSASVPLVLHLPGFDKEKVEASPFFELYSVGTPFEKALDTLVAEAAAGHVRPGQLSAFTGQQGTTLEEADAWLAGLMEQGDDALATQMRAMGPTTVLDHLLGGGGLSTELVAPGGQDAFWRQWERWTALPAAWRQTVLPPSDPDPGDMAFAVASWALGVEYVDDLERSPVNPLLQGVAALPRGVIDSARSLARYLRQRHDAFYRRTAEETEALLADEVEVARAEDLGRVDTFRFEEHEVLRAALAALGEENWQQALEWAVRRLAPEPGTDSFWLSQEPARKSAWELVHDAARLGRAIERAGPRLGPCDSLAAGVEAYLEHGAAVDQAHRHLEQRRAALLSPRLPELETLRGRLDPMRPLWRRWADAWARDWNTLCQHHGFLPDSPLRQRSLFAEVVEPLVDPSTTTAFFLLDAFRYEMAEELHRQLADTPAIRTRLTARLAELPTVTEVGMNVLAPLSKKGRLSPFFSADGKKIVGFSCGEFRVCDPETRRRAMHDRVGGKTCPSLRLNDVVERDSKSLRRSIAQARLLVVHSRETDRAGENELGPMVFEQVIQKVRTAWRLLHEAGVQRFVFAADHGFLLLDETSTMPLRHGRKTDPKGRHVFSPVAADEKGKVRVALAELDYEGVAQHVVFPASTAIFDTGGTTPRFVHGGNSLQERVIPVLTVEHRSAAGGTTARYVLEARKLEAVAGMHCLQVEVKAEVQSELDFGGPDEIDVALRVPEVDDVQVVLHQVRGPATLAGSVVRARVGERFELFFQLTGRTERRVLVELHHPSVAAEVAPSRPEERFAVGVRHAQPSPARDTGESVDRQTPQNPGSGESDWLDQLPAGGVRQIFEHLAVHGTVTEPEVTAMLDGPRAARRFARQLEIHCQKAPFDVRIEMVAAVKRYIREGGGD